jgi:ABC-type proline/glycine betaine transport system substrate-binding protein
MKVRVGGLIVTALAVAVALTGGSAAAKSNACGTVTINEQAWAGSTANTYVVKNVLEKSLGCKVKISTVAEVPV